MAAALRTNVAQLGRLALDALPTSIVSTDLYRRLRARVSGAPDRYRPLPAATMTARGGWRHRKLATTWTDLVVDGFPGSATSFLSNAVRAAVTRPANIESHFHYTTQLRRAMTFGVPAVVVVRAPADAADSWKSKLPEVWDWVAVLRWIRYHRFVLRHADRLHVVLFTDVVRDVDGVRRAIGRVATLTAQPLLADERLRRTSPVRTPIDRERWPVNWMLARADALYDAIGTRACGYRHPG